jgi:hypothetical protein
MPIIKNHETPRCVVEYMELKMEKGLEAIDQEADSVNDFCVRYNCSRTDFYRQINAGKISILKRGRRTFVSRTEGRRWFASLTVKNGGSHD